MPAAATGGYGTRQELADLQRSAPLAAARPSPLDLIPGGPAVFGPTTRPDEPQTTGLISEPSILPDDPDAVVRALYQIYPHPHLLKLMRGS